MNRHKKASKVSTSGAFLLETPIPDKLSSFNSFKAYDFFAEEFLVVV